MEWIKWIFSGIGVLIISVFVKKYFDSKGTKTSIVQKGQKNISANQINKIEINENTLSVSDVKEIAQTVYSENFYKLESIAKDKANKRKDEFLNLITNRISTLPSIYLNKFSEPYLQSSLFEAIKAYAKTGDKILKELLVSIIFSLVKEKTRTLKSIVFEESIFIAPKLTEYQFDILSLIFLILYSPNKNIKNWKNFEFYLRKYIVPFIKSVTLNSTCYRHFEYVGCAFIRESYKSIEDVLYFYYPGLFSAGFKKERFQDSVDKNFKKYIEDDLIIPCYHNGSLFQINAVDNKDIIRKCKYLDLDDSIIFKIKKIQKEHLMNNKNIQKSVSKIDENFSNLFSLWDKSFIKYLELTSVGVAIGIANIERKIGESLDYSIWINESADFNDNDKDFHKIPKIIDGGSF